MPYFCGSITEVVGQSRGLGVARVRYGGGDLLRLAPVLCLHLAALEAHSQWATPWLDVQLEGPERQVNVPYSSVNNYTFCVPVSCQMVLLQTCEQCLCV